jgi:hypothetical protein
MTEQQGWGDDVNANPFGDVDDTPDPADVWRELRRLAQETRAVRDGTVDRATARTMLTGWAEALAAISECDHCGGRRMLANGKECNRCAGKGVQSWWDRQRNATYAQIGTVPIKLDK